MFMKNRISCFIMVLKEMGSYPAIIAYLFPIKVANALFFHHFYFTLKLAASSLIKTEYSATVSCSVHVNDTEFIEVQIVDKGGNM